MSVSIHEMDLRRRFYLWRKHKLWENKCNESLAHKQERRKTRRRTINWGNFLFFEQIAFFDGPDWSGQIGDFTLIDFSNLKLPLALPSGLLNWQQTRKRLNLQRTTRVIIIRRPSSAEREGCFWPTTTDIACGRFTLSKTKSDASQPGVVSPVILSRNHNANCRRKGVRLAPTDSPGHSFWRNGSIEQVLDFRDISV